MRQRIMIALALVLEPKVLIADEPTTALDVIVEAQILGILADLRRNFDTAVLLITHNLGIVAEACDRVAVMYAGRIVEEGDAREVFSEPAHPYTRELLRATISLETTGLNYIPGAPPSLKDPPGGCRFHPRCPNAMRVCAVRDPIEMRAPGGQRVDCWLHGPSPRSAPASTEPLRGARSPRRRKHERAEAAPADDARDGGRAPLLEVDDLHTTYSVRGSFFDRIRGRDAGSVKAVDGVSLELRKGEVLGVVGESGSGKTTLGRTLLGLVEASGGSIKLEGREMDGRTRRRSCGRCAAACRSSSRTRTPRSTRR